MNYSGIVNIVMWALFGILIFATLLGAIIGMMKGFYKTTLKTIIKFIAVLVLVFLTPTISVYIGNFSFPNPKEPGTNTTILSFIANAIQKTDLVSPINGISIYETCILLATSLISFATFLAGVIVIQCLISLITAIFYHGIFRWFLPVETPKERKERKKGRKELENVTDKAIAKASSSNQYALVGNILDEDGEARTQAKVHKKWPLLRFPGFVLGGAQEFLFVLCLLAPITGLSRVIITNKETVNKAVTSLDLPQQEAQEIDKSLTIVENSIIYKLLGIGNFDTTLMNQATNVTLNNASVSFGGLLSTLLDIADPLLEDGTITFDNAAGTVTINFSMLLSITTVQSLVDKLNSPMIIALIPPLIDVAMNSLGENAVAVDGLDFSNINWENDLTLLKDIYAEIYDGAIKPMVTTPQINPQNFILKTSTMTDAEIDKYVNACRKLGEMESVEKNLPNILVAIGHLLQSQGFSILPTDTEAYSGVDFSSDLAVFANAVLRFFRTIGLDISPNIKQNEFQEKILAALKDDVKRSQVADLICGSADSQVPSGLLDTDLISALSLGTVVNSVLSSVPSISSYVQNVDVVSVIDSLDKVGRKNEFRKMFDLASKALDMDLGNLNEIDYTDPKFVAQLDELLGLAMESQIFNRLYPSIMKAVLFRSNGELSANLYGLSAYNFNFESEDFLEDFRAILSLIPDLATMQKALADPSATNADKLRAIDVECVKKLLYIAVGSDFLNSDQKTGITSNSQKNANIYTLFTNFFAEEPFKSIGFKVPTREQFEEIYWGNGITKGEIDVLGNIIEDAKVNAEFLTSTQMDLSTLVDPGKIADIAVQGFESKLLSPSILSIIDNSLNQYMQKLGFHISINDMRNELWKDDMNSLDDILHILMEIDLDHLDLNTLNPDVLNALLTVLSDMNIVKTSNDFTDRFGFVLYQILQKQGLFEKLGITDISASTFNTNNQWTLKKELKDFGSGRQFEITTEGEINSICYLLKVFQKFGLESFTEQGLPSGLAQEIINGGESVLNSVLIRSIISKQAQNVISQIDISPTFNNIIRSVDFGAFMTMSATEFANDLKLFENIYQLSKETVQVSGVEYNKINYMLEHIFDLKSVIVSTREDGTNVTLFDEFSEFISALCSSAILSSIGEGQQHSPLINMFASLVKSIGMEQNVTFVFEPTRVDEALYGMLHKISYDEKWGEEAVSLLHIVEDVQGLSPDKIGITSGLDLVTAKSVFTHMNTSRIFHKVPIALIKNAFEEKNLNAYFVDPDTGVLVHDVDYKVHLTTSQEDIDFWNNEYEHILELVLGEGGLKDIFSNPSSSVENIDFESMDPIFIYHLGSMKLFENVRSYLIYNIADHYKQEGTTQSPAEMIFSPAKNAPYGENEKVYRIEELFFRNPKLMTNGVLDKDKCAVDLALFKNVADIVLKNVVDIFNTSDIGSISLNFETLTNQCYSLEGGTLYRSDLASEIVAGMLSTFFKNPNLAAGAHLVSLDFYADNHALVNLIEGRAVDGLIDFVKENVRLTSLLPSDPLNAYTSKEHLLNIYSLFGIQPESVADSTTKTLLQYFYQNAKHSDSDDSLIYSGYNATISLQLQSYLLKYTVVKENTAGARPDSLQNVMTKFSIPFSNFHQVATDISTHIL